MHSYSSFLQKYKMINPQIKAKVMLFDADGVTLKRQVEYFSQRFAREHGAPLDEVTAFFKEKFRTSQLGKADLKLELEPLLPVWGWHKGADAFLEYWFSTDAPDREVLEKVAEFRAQDIACYLVTDQEKYRAAYIRNVLGFSKLFDDCFFSCELGFSKEQPEFFSKVLERMNLSASEALYWDDDQKNIDAAKSIGIDARFYGSITDLNI